jgi:hypothetical protein
MKGTKLLASAWVLGVTAVLNAGLFMLVGRINAQNCYPQGFGCIDWHECITDVQADCAGFCESVGSSCLQYRRIGPAQCDGHCYCYSQWVLSCRNGTQSYFDCYIASDNCYFRPQLLTYKGGLQPQK